MNARSHVCQVECFFSTLSTFAMKESSSLSYNWQWSYISSDIGCGVTLVNTGVSSVSLNVDFCPLDTVMLVAVNVSDSDTGRFGLYSVTVTVVEPNSPVVLLYSDVSKVNVQDKLSLYGEVKYCALGEAKWSVDEVPTWKDAAFASGSSALISSFSVRLFQAVVAGSLYEGTSYTFRLSCSKPNDLSSSSSVVIATNSAPLPGVFEVTPLEGQMLATLFTMTASNWVEDDLSLSYEFGYESYDGLFLYCLG
jgi:hypothetical protein